MQIDDWGPIKPQILMPVKLDAAAESETVYKVCAFI
jgi:hypothetical protein